MKQWPQIEAKLQKERKAALVSLIHDLTAVSPEVQQFLQARYLHAQNAASRLKPYKRRIKHPFQGDYPSLDLAAVWQTIQAYRLAARDDTQGAAELWVYALETVAAFLQGIGMHDVDFFNELTDLVQDCAAYFMEFPHLYPAFARRLRAVSAQLDASHLVQDTRPLHELIMALARS